MYGATGGGKAADSCRAPGADRMDSSVKARDSQGRWQTPSYLRPPNHASLADKLPDKHRAWATLTSVWGWGCKELTTNQEEKGKNTRAKWQR